jgi:hypothetical protein
MIFLGQPFIVKKSHNLGFVSDPMHSIEPSALPNWTPGGLAVTRTFGIFLNAESNLKNIY